MKIAIVTPYRHYSGGVESVNEIIRKIFEEAGHEVYFVTSDDVKLSFLEKIIVKFIGQPYITAKRFRELNKLFDVVIANGEFGLGIDHPHIINIFHGTYKGFRDALKKSITFKEYLGFSLKAYIQKKSTKGTYVVTVSEYVKNILESDNIIVDQVLTNSIDGCKFYPATDNSTRKNYLFVGSYNYYAKGFDILEKLAKKDFKIDCVTNRKPSSSLGWIQNIDNSKMREVYNRYKMLIFPSRFEGIGLVPLEAMACGLPIIMSNVGLGPQLKKIIPEFVVNSYDENDYSAKIKHIENNYEEYSRKAREYVEKYHSFDNYKKQWLELIERVANA